MLCAAVLLTMVLSHCDTVTGKYGARSHLALGPLENHARPLFTDTGRSGEATGMARDLKQKHVATHFAGLRRWRRGWHWSAFKHANGYGPKRPDLIQRLL